MTVHLYASRPHLWAHMAPIWDALPPEVRGGRYAPRADAPWADERLPRVPPAGLWMIAAASDSAHMHMVPRIVYVEHGAGQTYQSIDSASYSGGRGHERVVLFIGPSEQVADRWRARYPQARAVAVGCPRLDRWHRNPMAPVPGVVAVSFHWPCGLVPETQWTLPHYRQALNPLRDAVQSAGGVVWGHGHPRAWRQLSTEWGRRGVLRVEDADRVLDQASLLVIDNSSLAFEVASLGRPVVLMNAPWFRRGVEHGLRFWSDPPGVQVDHPGDLVDVVLDELAHPDRSAGLRARAVEAAYAATDGHAAERAAAAILEVI